MLTTVSKWGNSLGVRIPKSILNSSGIQEMDEINLSVEGNRIIITKAMPTSIRELFQNYNEPEKQKEIDWGEPQGSEIW